MPSDHPVLFSPVGREACAHDEDVCARHRETLRKRSDIVVIQISERTAHPIGRGAGAHDGDVAPVADAAAECLQRPQPHLLRHPAPQQFRNQQMSVVAKTATAPPGLSRSPAHRAYSASSRCSCSTAQDEGVAAGICCCLSIRTLDGPVVTRHGPASSLRVRGNKHDGRQLARVDVRVLLLGQVPGEGQFHGKVLLKNEGLEREVAHEWMCARCFLDRCAEKTNSAVASASVPSRNHVSSPSRSC